MLEIASLLLLNLAFAGAFWVEYRLKSPAVLLVLALYVAFGVPHTVDVLFGSDRYSMHTFTYASVFASIFVLLYGSTRFLLGKVGGVRLQWKKYVGIVKQTAQKFDRVLAGGLLVSVLLWCVAIYRVSGSLMSSTWSMMLAADSGLAMAGNYIYYASCGVLLLMWIRKKKLALASLSVLVLLAIVVTRARAMLIPPVVPFVLVMMYAYRGAGSKFKMALMGVGIIVAVFLVQQVRYQGSIADALVSSPTELMAVSVQNIASGQGELSLREGFYHFVENRNQFQHFGQGRTYLRLMFLPIPSRLINMFGEIKPPDFAGEMYEALHPWSRFDHGTSHPTLFGDAFANFNGWGMLLGIFWAFVASIIDQVILGRKPLFAIASLAPISAFYVLLARGAVYNSSALLFWSLVLVGLMYFVSNRVRIAPRGSGVAVPVKHLNV